MLAFVLAIIFFLLGMVFSFNRTISYSFGVLGAISAVVLGLEGYKDGFYYQWDIYNNVSLAINIDKVSSFFIIIAYICFALIAFYSIDFGKLFKKSMAFLMNFLMLSMLIVFCAADFISFLITFELVTIILFFSILERPNTQKEGYIFLAFSEVSYTLLFVGFAVVIASNGLFLFKAGYNNVLFAVFTFLGFVVKMDGVPTHVWVPLVYPKAPSNIAAILSVPLTLIGAYGVFRVLVLSDNYSYVLGILAIIIGSISAFWGALQAARETHLKTLPAYSTIENNGMILTAVGLSALAKYSHLTVLSKFSYLTALIIIIAHSLSKTTMFLTIGHAKEMLGRDSIDDVRGILKHISKPAGIGLLISGLSFSAVPPLVGFVAEWMLLESLFQSYKFSDFLLKFIITFAGILIALAMGLSSFSMKKLVGFSDLGELNFELKRFKDFTMKWAENILSFLIITSGVLSFLIIKYLGYEEFLDGLLGVPKPTLIVSSRPIFGVISPFMFFIVVGFFLISLLIILKAQNKNVKTTIPWVGGLPLKENEVYNTRGYSFIVEYVLRGIYRTKELRTSVETYDISNAIYDFLVRFFKRLSAIVSNIIMNGYLHYYIIYIIAIFVIALIVFKL